MNHASFEYSELLRDVATNSAELRIPAAQRMHSLLGCSAKEALATRPFVVLGSYHESEIRVLCKHAHVIAIVDDALAKQKSMLLDVPVCTTDDWVQLLHKNPDAISCVLTSTPNGYLHFARSIAQWNVKALWPVQFLELLQLADVDVSGETGRFFWYGHSFLEATMQDLDYLHGFATRLEDDYSRFTWYSVINYRLTLNPFYLVRCAVGHHFDRFALNSYSCNRQFFQFGPDEVFVDGGAYVGDTAEQFIRAVSGRFRAVHSFEPATTHHPAIRERIRKLRAELAFSGDARIVLSDCGLWSEETTLTFNPSQIVDPAAVEPTNAQSAHLVDTGILDHIYAPSVESAVSIKVPVTTIDASTDESATFIKLEIEGAELEALRGSRNTLQRRRPKMALSLYHKPEDLRTITQFIVDQELEYRFGFRQHNALVPDAMVLLLPLNERRRRTVDGRTSPLRRRRPRTHPLMMPSLPTARELLPYSSASDAARWYSNFGPLVNEFEARIAASFASANPVRVVSLSSCTAGIELALRALSLPPGAPILVPALTFIATASAVRCAGLSCRRSRRRASCCPTSSASTPRAGTRTSARW
jgi:FkbM family methyltransferase